MFQPSLEEFSKIQLMDEDKILSIPYASFNPLLRNSLRFTPTDRLINLLAKKVFQPSLEEFSKILPKRLPEPPESPQIFSTLS